MEKRYPGRNFVLLGKLLILGLNNSCVVNQAHDAGTFEVSVAFMPRAESLFSMQLQLLG
jgi:hypothetical protein